MRDPTTTDAATPARTATAPAAVAIEVRAALAGQRVDRWFAWAGLAMLVVAFSSALLAYAHDTYYQSHFVFLWLFFGAAVFRAGRSDLCLRVGCSSWRDAAGLIVALAALGMLYVGLLTGSSTAQRLGLVGAFLAVGLLALRGWTVTRCLLFALFALLCFGVPYSTYHALTDRFRSSFMFLLEAMGPLLGYRADGVVLVFADYRLAITPDCSGFNQLVTFFGLAFLGTLTGRTTARRALLLFVVATVLAYASNLFRVLVFVVGVACGQHALIENEDLHAAVGFVAYAPFIVGFIALILRTHRPLPAPAAPLPRGRRRLPLGLLALPFLGLWGVDQLRPPPYDEPPDYTAGLQQPPGYRIAARASTEAWERDAYDTPWLVNARFAAVDGSGSFELFAYLTRSRSHLAVHQISNCLAVPGYEVVYGPPVVVDGRTFWSLELTGKQQRYHGYFAFWVDGEDRDDSLATQLHVFRKRLLGGVREVGLTRFLLPGPLAAELPARDRALLAWRAAQLNALR